jgi:hypothetical protein
MLSDREYAAAAGPESARGRDWFRAAVEAGREE